MIKLHLFSGFENKRLGITPDMELGHLYSDTGDRGELCEAAASVGLYTGTIQEKEGLVHFDLWGQPLARAIERFPLATDAELYEDMKKIKRKKGR